MDDALLLAQLASTLAMTGLIGFVQVVHYPLMERVGPEGFARYAREHQSRTTLVVAPLMLTEAATSLLLIWVRPAGVSLLPCSVGLAMLAVLWLSTWLWKVPIHREMAEGFHPEVVRRLVRSNWLRTAGWSARGAVVLWMTAQRLTA